MTHKQRATTYGNEKESHRTCEVNKLKNRKSGWNEHSVPASSIDSGRELEKKVSYRHGSSRAHAQETWPIGLDLDHRIR